MASDVLEAEEVIKRIRKGHGIIEGDLIEELKRNPDLAVALKELHINLRNSVKLLSEELNTKDAHCVLEMIQNADDNSYEPGIKPKLHFHLQPMTLRVDCNEKGFSEADVKAICSIGQSTKPIEGCIGEKGIGFKSCWKIANIVAISSGPYSFKFDRSKDLGMIAPIPAVFPSHEYLDGHTQILLELQTQEKAEHLEEEFKSLPPTLLMFLRRLRHLRIDFGAKAYKEICCEPNQQGDLLYLTTKDKEESGTEVTTKVSYIVAKHKMQAYASEPKRKGVSETEIVLGFPMSADDSPLGATQNAHAILPLRDYGFKFMIQADFLLPASREDILRCPWNQNLLSGIPIAFCQAVKKLNEKPSLRYSWTRYLPDRLPHSFLSPLSDTLREALTDTKVLYSWTGSLEEPRLLVHIPPRFLNRKGSPIMISDQSELRLYLSPKYSWFTDQDSLRKLGVTEFADQDFLNKLKTLYPTKTTKTNDADQKWHEDVAKALNTLSHSRWSTQISHLPLVPLRDGRWISMASVKEAVFLDQPDGMSTPTGIDIQLVDKYATTNPGRLRLYNNLGIKTCSSYEISNLILRKHQTGYQSLSSSRDAAMHLVYLYRARSTKPLLPYSLIWVYDGAKTWVKPKDLYIEIPGQNFFADLFSKDPDCLRFIHSDYITIVRGNEQASWLQWLVETLSLSTQPRLVEEGGLSRAFKSIIKHHDSVTWLNILRDPKRRYKPSNHPNVCEELAGTKVICVDGKVRKLDETVFPTPAIRTVCAKFDIEPPIIKVDDPSYEGWIKLLQPLGVGMKVTVGFYIEALKCIKDTNHVDRTQVFRIYQALAEIQDQAALRKAFLHEDLILKWSLDNASWIAMSACVWNAPLRLRSKIALSGIWPDCEKFFRLSLGVENATLDMIVEEIKRTSWGSDTSDVGMIKSLFTTLIRFAPDYGAEAKRAQIDGFSTGTFFIADRHYLHESFTGKVPILDFSVGEVHKLHKIFDLLNLRNKYLSNVVEEDYNTSGSQELDHRLTTMFRSKANALARCAQYWRPSQAMKDTLQKQSELLGLKVIRVSKITLRRYLTHQGQTISVESEGELQVVPFADGLNVYLPVEEAKLQLVNQLYLPNEIAKFLGILDRSLFIGVILQSNKDVVDTLLDYQGVPKLQDEEFISMDSLSNTEGTGQSLEDYPSLSKIATNQRSTSDSSKSAVIGGKSIVEHGESITRRVSTNRITPTFSAMVQSRPSLEFQMTNLMISSGTGPTTESGLYRSPAAPLSRELMVRNIKSAKERFQEMQTSLKIRGSQSTEFPVEAVNLLDIAKYKPTKRKGRNSRATKNAPQRQNNVSAARDFEIGVSGEQFAFEYLKNAVPDFNETHWTSNLKAFTKLHPDYKDFESYDAPEVSDFVFEDKRGQLTAFLVDRGHEESKAWLAEPPTYYLEVKATTEGHHAPFSMSNWQYKLAQDLMLSSQESTETPKAVYMILRVFDLKTSPGIVVYLDPGTMITDGRLCSTPKDGMFVWPAS